MTNGNYGTIALIIAKAVIPLLRGVGVYNSENLIPFKQDSSRMTERKTDEIPLLRLPRSKFEGRERSSEE